MVMSQKTWLIWGDGVGVEKSYKKEVEKEVEKLVENPIENPIENPVENPVDNPLLPAENHDKHEEYEHVAEKMSKLNQYLQEKTTTRDFMEEGCFIGGFMKKNDRDVVNKRLSERMELKIHLWLGVNILKISQLKINILDLQNKYLNSINKIIIK